MKGNILIVACPVLSFDHQSLDISISGQMIYRRRPLCQMRRTLLSATWDRVTFYGILGTSRYIMISKMVSTNGLKFIYWSKVTKKANKFSCFWVQGHAATKTISYNGSKDRSSQIRTRKSLSTCPVRSSWIQTHQRAMRCWPERTNIYSILSPFWATSCLAYDMTIYDSNILGGGLIQKTSLVAPVVEVQLDDADNKHNVVFMGAVISHQHDTDVCHIHLHTSETLATAIGETGQFAFVVFFHIVVLLNVKTPITPKPKVMDSFNG